MAAEKATEAFGIPELLEDILLNLNTRDTLRAMRVNRAMRDSVLGSVKIQKNIGLLPDYDADFLALPWSDADHERDPNACLWMTATAFHGLKYWDFAETYCTLYDSRYPLHQFYPTVPNPCTYKSAGFNIRAEGHTALQRLGSRCRALSPCQPPLSAASILGRCENCFHAVLQRNIQPVRDIIGILAPSNGEYVTIGDLCSAVLAVRKKHRRSCKYGLDKADMCIEFEGSVELRKKDPIMVLRRDREWCRSTYGYEAVDGDEDGEGDVEEEEQESSGEGSDSSSGASDQSDGNESLDSMATEELDTREVTTPNIIWNPHWE